MPMYAYKCDDCGCIHEHLQKFNDPAAPCPECASLKQTKQISTGTGFCLMGRDWFKPGMTASKTGQKQ